MTRCAESGTAQETYQEELDKPERTDIREEAPDGTGTQTWDKEQKPDTASTKPKGIQQDPQGDPRTRVWEANSRSSVGLRSGIGHCGGVHTSETVEEPARRFSVRRVGNVGAPATRDSLSPHRWEKEEKLWMMVILLDWLKRSQRAVRGGWTMNTTGKWDWSETSQAQPSEINERGHRSATWDEQPQDGSNVTNFLKALSYGARNPRC
jgi:hypothetical protein